MPASTVCPPSAAGKWTAGRSSGRRALSSTTTSVTRATGSGYVPTTSAGRCCPRSWFCGTSSLAAARVGPDESTRSFRRASGARSDRSNATIDIVQRAGLTLDEIRELTGPDNDGPRARDRIRALAERKLADIDALIACAQAVKTWLEIAKTSDSPTVEVCSSSPTPRSRRHPHKQGSTLSQ